MQPAIILLVFVSDCKAFAYLQTPFVSHDSEHLYKGWKKKKAILFLLRCPRDKCFFFCLLYHLNFAALSLTMWDWKPAVVFPPLLFHHPQLQRVWISHKIQDTGHMNWVKLKWELVKKKKKKRIDVEHLDGSFTKYFSGYKNVLMTEGSLHLPRPATCSVLLSPLCQQVHCMNLPEIHPLKY